MKIAIVHIADIHYRKGEPEGVSTILKAFLHDLKQQKQKLPDYDILLGVTGDIVYAGNDADSYNSLFEEIDNELNKMGLTKDFRMMVPGNHDIDRNVLNSDLKKHKEQIKDFTLNETKFNDSLDKEDIFNNTFENYKCFESDFAKYCLDFNTAGNGHTINKNFGVYCLNTALCSFGGINKINDKNKLAIYSRGLVNWCKKATTKNNILLMHHPLNHLIDWSKIELKQIIENNFILCLTGHDHEQDILYNKISQKSLICASPQLWSKKPDKLGYSIILLDDNRVEKIIYRQYVKGKFLVGNYFSENEYGIVELNRTYKDVKEEKNIELLEEKFNNSLAFFKNQPKIFVKRKLSETRKFNDEENLLDEMIINPQSAIIFAQPQFGLTSLSHYMRLEAYKNHTFWIYLDAEHIKSRNILKTIEELSKSFDKEITEIKCIILDSWNSSILDHCNSLKNISNKFKDIPIIVMSRYTGYIQNSDFDFSQLEIDFVTLHLQALERNDVRDFVSKYNNLNHIANEDKLVTKVVRDLEAINVHRTPLNCFTLLKVLENNYDENLINRTKLIKAVLLILFTDYDSFTYSSTKPDTDDVEIVLGKFCVSLIKSRSTNFKCLDFKDILKQYAKEEYLTIDVDLIIDILESNYILLRFNEEFEFRHSYWIYYFAATFMLKDEEFKKYILMRENYVNYPEIIEFYTGIDGRREEAAKILMKDTNDLIMMVNDKIGIIEGFNPYQNISWHPTEENIEEIRKEISEKVNMSDLPLIIKDQHADKTYDSEAPYNQSINSFFNDYKVLCLLQSIKASSRALRNSKSIKPDLKFEMFKSIINGWEQISKVIFWVSPILAMKGKVSYDGWGLLLDETFNGTVKEKLKSVYLCIPSNVVNFLKDDISSKKIGPLFYEILENNYPELHRHFISLFLIKEKPIDWQKKLFNYMNLLHRNSFYLGNLNSELSEELKIGFITKEERSELKKLRSIVVAKHKYAPKHGKKRVPNNMAINQKNILPIDKILASQDKNRKFIPKRLQK